MSVGSRQGRAGTGRRIAGLAAGILLAIAGASHPSASWAQSAPARPLVGQAFQNIDLGGDGVIAPMGVNLPTVSDTLGFETGMEVSISAGVKRMIESFPEHDVVLCVAGCIGPRTSVVHQRGRAAVLETVSVPSFLPTASSPAVIKALEGTLPAGQRPTMRSGKYYVEEAPDVICMAGCLQDPGGIVFKGDSVAFLSNDAQSALKVALQSLAHRIAASERPGQGEARLWIGRDAVANLRMSPPAIGGWQTEVRVFASPVASFGPELPVGPRNPLAVLRQQVVPARIAAFEPAR